MNGQALNGVRVIDLTHSWAGPHGTRILADYGADVIRIEYVQRLCMCRGGRTDEQRYDKWAMWDQVNRAKKSLTLDLRDECHRAVFLDLVTVADILFDNARGGVLERVGLGYEDLKKIKPDIIMVSMSAYGKTGPDAALAGYGGTLEALGGIQNLTGYSPDGKPVRVKEVDVTNGVSGACAALTALFHKRRTGEGQWVDLSQLESAMHATIGEHLLQFAMNGSHKPIMGNRHARFAPHGCYACAGEDRWLTIVVRSDDEWSVFCDALGHAEWETDERFATAAARRRNHDELDRLVGEWTAQQDRDEAMRLLQERGVAAGAVNTVEDLARDEHLAARGFFVRATDGSPGLFPGFPARLSVTPAEIRAQGPKLGEHNDEVIRGLLGRPKEDVPTFTEQDIGTAIDPY